MPCHAMHPIQDLFLESFSYVLQFDMHFICTPMWTKFYSCKKCVLHAPTHVRNFLWHQKLLQDHRQPAMEALPWPMLSRTMLEEGWNKWLWRKPRTPRPWSIVHLSSILFCPNHSLLSFLFSSLESRGMIPIKGVVLSHPKVSNFGMWLKFTKF
jgi:hypothetical protein